MNIVGVSACSAGIAHTYIAKEKIEQAAKLLGHKCKIETQGSIGVEDELTAADIAEADVVLLAVDIKIHGEERFKGKPVVKMPITKVTNIPVGVLQSIEKALKKK